MWAIARAGCLTAAVSLGSFSFGYVVSGDFAAARTYAFTTLVFAELLRSFGERSVTQPIWQLGVPANMRLALVVAVSIASQFAILHHPLLRRLFDIAPISIAECVPLFALGCIPFLALEARKSLRLHLRTADIHEPANAP